MDNRSEARRLPGFPAGQADAPTGGPAAVRGEPAPSRVLHPPRTGQPERCLRRCPRCAGGRAPTRRTRPRPSLRSGSAPPTRPPPSDAVHRLSESVRACGTCVLDSMVSAPAWVRNGRSEPPLPPTDLASPSRPLSSKTRSDRPTPPGFTFLDPHTQEFYVDWDRIANDMVGILRAEAGRNPYDRSLTDLIGELSTPQRRVPNPVGRPQRALSPDGGQEVAPSRRGRSGPHLRGDGASG